MIKTNAIPPLPETKSQKEILINKEWAEWVDKYKGVWVPKDGYPKENKWEDKLTLRNLDKHNNLNNCRVTPEEWEEKWKKKWEDQPGKMTPEQKFRNEYLQEGFVVKEEENGSHLKEVQSPSLVDSKLWDKLSKWISSWNKRIRVIALSKNNDKK
jgi:hypothetical protein